MSKETETKEWSHMGSVETLAAKVAIIMVWYISDKDFYDRPEHLETEDEFERQHFQETLANYVAYSPLIARKEIKLVAGYGLNLFDIFDALGSYPERDKELDDLKDFYHKEWSKKH